MKIAIPQYLFIALVVPLIFYVKCCEPVPCWILAISFVFVMLALYAFITIIAGASVSRGVFDFLVGDEGSFSLSRLQAVLWGVVILSSQVAVILFFGMKDQLTFRQFELVFSESAIWLLGLSLTSYISVKGISISRITQQPQLYKNRKPRASNIIMGSNGLDFSKCQMLVWTIIGIGIFTANTYYFLEGIDAATSQDIVTSLLHNHYEEYSNKPVTRELLNEKPLPFVPYLPWSFVVLMGLSQGAYVGKKLVPNFKLDEAREARQVELEESEQNLIIKKELLTNLATINSGSLMDAKNQKAIISEIDKLDKKILTIRKDIHDIEYFKQAAPQ